MTRPRGSGPCPPHIIIVPPSVAGVNLALFAGALVTLYFIGYVAGAWLVPPVPGRPGMALAVVRLVAGLFLSTTLFMLSLAAGVPWWSGPGVVVVAALGIYRMSALAPPYAPALTSWQHGASSAIAFVLLAPVLISSVVMGRGDYPPVFFNVDTPYFLEKVHSLARTNEFPPPSLGVQGGRYVYHYGAHAAAALIARVSTLPPHQAVFLVLLPLLLAGIFAAAVLITQAAGDRLPWTIAVPLLLVSAPTLWYPFWHDILPLVQSSIATASLGPLDSLRSTYELWGVASVSGQNLASQFIVLAVVGGIVAAPVRGWRLPLFLIGSAVLFKAQTAVALLGGFTVMQGWEAVRTRSVRPLAVVIGAASVFAVVYSALWILPHLPESYRTEVHPLAHVHYLQDRGWLPGFGADVLWLLAPALIAWRGSGARERSRVGWLLLSLTPLVIVNAFRGLDLRPGMGYDEDWFQIVMVVPVLAGGIAVVFANAGWPAFSPTRKAILFVVAVLTFVPPALVSLYYAQVLIEAPQSAHEFADNHALGEALRVIPVKGSLLVTNDLRYPSGGFARKNRQMQIPALFGHQAFAINYAYEVYTFSQERMALQNLLEQEQWSSAIDDAARRYGWTHFIVRKDYSHPRDIPLTRVFDGPDYEVFRFPPVA
jgi:hypothetical protein